MSKSSNPVINTYSRLADEYDEKRNLESCWGSATINAMGKITLKDRYGRVVDLGCGTGRGLADLASKSPQKITFLGIEPAEKMRERARWLNKDKPNVRILDGSFEQIPMESGSVDYLYSIMAFHWTTDPERSVQELARVLGQDGEMDLIFIGRENGHEFIRKTSPIFLRYMGPAGFLQSAKMRKQLSLEEARKLFGQAFEPPELTIQESHHTYYDTLEGHWGWWVRIEGHFIKISPECKEACDRDVRKALSELETEKGIPYMVHALHVRVRRCERGNRDLSAGSR